MTTESKPRFRGCLILLTAIVVGLGSRSTSMRSWPIVGPYGGDAAWTIAVCAGVRMLAPRLRARWIVGIGIALSFAVELSQLLQYDWLVAIRDTSLGALALGRGFLASDLLAYTVGAAIFGVVDAFSAEVALRLSRRSRCQPPDPSPQQ